MTLPFLRAFGVDPGRFQVLRRAFWTLSRREPPGLVQAKANRRGWSMGQATWIYVLYGGLVGIAAAFLDSRILFGVTFLTMALVMLLLAVVADFASVVVAPGEDEILFHLPITSRTYLAARLTVAAQHTAVVALALGAIPSVVAAVKWRNALCVPLYLGATVWTGWFALVLAFVVYRAALRLLGGERLRTLLALLPAFVSLVFALGPQILFAGRTQVVAAGSVSAWIDRYGVFVPPAWFASIVEAALLRTDGPNLLRAAIGLAAVPLSAWMLVVALGRGYLQDLQRLVSGHDAGRPSRTGRPAVAPRRPWKSLPGLETAEARAGWLLYAGAMRSRASLARAVPSLVTPVAFQVFGVIQSRQDGVNAFSPIVPYLVASAPAMLLMLLPYHEDHDAVWCLQSSPMRRYGRFWLGIVGAMLVRHVLVAAVAVTAIALAFDPRWTTLAGLVHAFVGALLTVCVVGAVTWKRLPFSRAFTGSQAAEGIGVTFLALLVLGVLGGLHALVLAYAPWAFLVTIPAATLLGLLWLRSLANELDRNPPAELALRPSGLRPARVGSSRTGSRRS